MVPALFPLGLTHQVKRQPLFIEHTSQILCIYMSSCRSNQVVEIAFLLSDLIKKNPPFFPPEIWVNLYITIRTTTA